MKIRDIELLETLTELKRNTNGVEGSAWALDSLFALIKQNEDLTGKSTEELKDLSRVMAETLTKQQGDTISGYIHLAQLVIVLLSGVDALTHEMLQQNKENELGLQFSTLSDAIYNNLVESGLLTTLDVVNIRKEVLKGGGIVGG